MQEQPHYKITPEQGWASLKPLLDDVLPVDRKRHRFAFFWWSASTLIITAVIGLAFVKGVSFLGSPPAVDHSGTQLPASRNIQAYDVKDAVPAVQMESSGQQIDKSTSNIPLGSSQRQNASSTKSTDTPGQARSSNSMPASKSEIKKNEIVPMASLDNPSLQGMIASQEIQNNLQSTLYPDPLNDVPVSSPMEARAVVTTSVRNVQVMETLPLLDEIAFAMPIHNTENISGGTAVKAKRNPRFLEPNVAVSGLAGLNGGFGLYGGAGLNANVSRRFSITTDFGFLSYRPHASLFSGAKSLDTNAEYNQIINYNPSYLGNETYVEGAYLDNEASYNAISPLVDKVTQWQAGIGMKWKCTTRFFLDGGVKIGFLTKGYSEFPIARTDLTGTSLPTVRFVNSLNSFDVIRPTTTSLHAGVGYRFGKHLEVFSNWTHAFDEYLLSSPPSATVDQAQSNRTDYIRGLNVGLRYTL